MRSSARCSKQMQLESFVDLVWAVPMRKQSGNSEAGCVLQRAKGLALPKRRIVLLRGYQGKSAPSLLAF